MSAGTEATCSSRPSNTGNIARRGRVWDGSSSVAQGRVEGEGGGMHRGTPSRRALAEALARTDERAIRVSVRSSGVPGDSTNAALASVCLPASWPLVRRVPHTLVTSWRASWRRRPAVAGPMAGPLALGSPFDAVGLARRVAYRVAGGPKLIGSRVDRAATTMRVVQQRRAAGSEFHQ